MISALRRGANSWAFKGLLLLLVASFMLWGVESARLGGPSSVAEVGDVRVSPEEYQRALNLELNARSRDAEQAYTPAQAFEDGVDRMVLERLVTGAALDQAAADLGLYVSDQRVADSIHEYAAFRGPDGQFDKTIYSGALRQQGFTPPSFEQEQRHLIQRSDLLSTLGAGVTVPEVQLNAVFDYLTEQRWVRYFVIPAGSVSDLPEPTDEDLKAFYEAHQDRYTLPERRSYTYLTLTREQLADRADVTDAEVEREYQARKGDFGTPEQRDIKQIIVPTEDDAKALRRKIEEGTAFQEAAKEAGMSAAEVSMDGAQEDKLSYLGEDAAQQIFALPEGELSAPIETKLGWGLFKVDSVTPGDVKPLDEVAGDIRQSLRDTEASHLLSDLSEEARARIAQGATIEQLAEFLKVEVHTVKEADRTGQNADGQTVPGAPTSEAFVKSLFSKVEGEFIDLEDNGDGGYFVTRLDKIVPAQLQPFDAVKEKVRTAWINDARRNAVQNKAEALAKKVREGAPMAEAAVDAGATLETTPPFNRSGRVPDIFGRDLIMSLFDGGTGDVKVGQSARGNGYVVAQIAETKTTPVDPDSREYRTTRELLEQSLKNDIYAQFQTYIFDEHSVTRNETLLGEIQEQLR